MNDHAEGTSDPLEATHISDELTSWRPLVRALAITAVLTALAWVADAWAYARWYDPKVYDRDWGRLLRVMGFLGTWLALAVAIALQEGAEPARRALAKRRASLLFWSAALGGLVAEVGKLTIRRERPEPHDGVHVFRDWGERTWSTAGLAMPSSHTLVAFAGAAMLARLYPRVRWVGYALAAGCALTRVMARAHFLSDVVLAAGLGWVVAWGMDRLTSRSASSAPPSDPPTAAARAGAPPS
ncbi:MAG: phosphatase PAP2 family protein [Gemmatimonadetes bacterium]|nr:phosphatase PAP2 family protein [Gemmatimonadota bacterium]